MINYLTYSDFTVVLDPTGLYDIPQGYTVIKTEVEWIKSFFVLPGCYWVTGKGSNAKQLCDWSQEWLRVWNKTDAILEIKKDPCIEIKSIFGSVAIPDHWTDEQLLSLATQLSRYPRKTAIADYLTEQTQNDLWQKEASEENLAAWLGIQLSNEYQPLEKVWQHQHINSNLSFYYQTDDKARLLRQWLGIVEPPLHELNVFPNPVPNWLSVEFERYWQEQLYKSECKVLDELIPSKQADMKRVANVAYQVLSNRQQWIINNREKRLANYLNQEQKQHLYNCQPPLKPEPLPLSATPEQTLNWVTQKYLPFRRWEIMLQQVSTSEKFSDYLADSFIEWLLEHYPQLKVAPVNSSLLNYNVTEHTLNLCNKNPVFWVVIDGLGWLDHLDLLSYLKDSYGLNLETEIQPRFSLLPTKTEYAKWGLYAQKTPKSLDWTNNCSKVFEKLGKGQRYTDTQMDSLYQDLKANKHLLYCWDTTKLDELYHDRVDWLNLYKVKRPSILEQIAREINHCIKQYPQPENLTLVIASDHGQILGLSNSLSACPPELQAKGRMGIGKTNDSRFVVLDCDRYDLPHDISIVRSSATINAFNYTKEKQVIGSHGGLFPEEVIVGFSVLHQSTQRLPIFVSCWGEGKPREPGQIQVTIDNPNSISITNLWLYIEELPTFQKGYSLSHTISANEKQVLDLPIPAFPELPSQVNEQSIKLSGYLTFEYTNSETDKANLLESSLTVKQIFSSGLDINEFL